MIVVIIVYNRYENLQRWIRCWKLSNQHGAQLVVIHNFDKTTDFKAYEKLCFQEGIKYIPRVNQGFDIGAFQDVCLERLPGFPKWESLLWITDDVVPTDRNFLEPFLIKLREGVGVACLEISKEITSHIRTTGFALTKETAKKLVFPADPVLTKKQCYEFEHRGGDKTFLKQIQAMGLRAEMLAPLESAPLWDTGSRKNLKRWVEHENAFKPRDKVAIICTIYNTYPFIISSLLAQTHSDWELILIHDGPNNLGLKAIVESYNDSRIKYIETNQRLEKYGHPLRKWALEEMRRGVLSWDAKYVLITNADNYHVPVYLEYMINGFKANPKAVATFCDKMVHSYRAWDSQDCRFERGYLDCAGVLVRRDIACDIGWRSNDHSADWFYFVDIADKYGRNNFQKVKGCLLVHN